MLISGPMRKPTIQNAALDAARTIWQQVMADIGAGRSAQDKLAQLSASVQALRQTVIEAEKLYEIALAAESAAGGRAPNAPAPAPRTGKLKTLESKAQRSAVIRQAAARLAARSGGRVDLDGVGDAVIADGFDLDTPVPGTMIGNVLNKSPDWKRLHKGAYEYVGRPPIE